MSAYWVYLAMEGALALLLSMIFTASSLYQVTVAGLTPLQLVLVGTTLETSVFLFEVPTGVVADVYSRRLSIIIGIFLIGLGFLVEGSFPIFWLILLAQVLWGVGFTFTSGATQAWITDEIGEEAAGKAFLRSSQVDKLGGLLGIGLGIILGNVRVNLPIQLGGVMICLMAAGLAFCMPEHGFKPRPSQSRNPFHHMLHIFRIGLRTVRTRPALITILWIGLIFGLFSEGYDRLWTKHLIDNFAGGFPFGLQPVVWIGGLRALGMLFSIGAAELARRKIPTGSHVGIARSLMAISALLLAGLFGFALARSLALALICYWVIAMARSVISPVYDAWVNQRLDSTVRATVLSMSSQVDAVGQIAGGPAVGMIGSWLSVRAALTASALILLPVLALFRRAISQPQVEWDQPSPFPLLPEAEENG